MAKETHRLPRRLGTAALRLLLVGMWLALLLATAAYLASFALHAWLILAYPYPLDYGEGPLLAQITMLREGWNVGTIYTDPATPGSVIVNYPPCYLWLTATLSALCERMGLPAAAPLQMGRLLSLLASLGCAAAIFALSSHPQRQHHTTPWAHLTRRLLPAALFLTIPVVREWGVLLRVDMFGVCLGLWGLVALRSLLLLPPPTTTTWSKADTWAFLAGLLFALTLYTKPSLLAAPLAGCLWLLFALVRSRRAPPCRAMLTSAALLIFGVLALAALFMAGLHLLTDGWFLLHVVTANANRWQADLAWGFWIGQAQVRWPLALAALLAALWLLVVWQHRRAARRSSPPDAPPSTGIMHADDALLPLLYTLAALPAAVGVGKVGAYANYFLELYAGLVWLVALALNTPPHPRTSGSGATHPPRRAAHFAAPATLVLVGLLLASLAYYPPLWSKTLLRQGGIVDENPPRLAFGRYGMWRDLQREAEILQAQARVQAALIRHVQQVRADDLFTDLPGVAVQAGNNASIQVFEHRQLLDQDEWDQRGVLWELNHPERLPLVVLDYLGNWLTPEMISMIKHHYAMDGSLGTFDIYRAVESGVYTSVSMPFERGIYLSGYYLHEPGSISATRTTTPTTPTTPTAPIQAGNLLVVTLEWLCADPQAPVPPSVTPPVEPHTAVQAEPCAMLLPAWDEHTTPDVVLQLVDSGGTVRYESERPLLNGVLPPTRWQFSGRPWHHMQPLQLPTTLLTDTYRLAVTLRSEGRDLEAPRILQQVRIAPGHGRFFAEAGYFVPEPIAQQWYALGAEQRVGIPVMPAVPFGWGTLQCFEYTCLELRDGSVVQRPLGEQLYLAETLRSKTCGGAMPFEHFVAGICPDFREDWQRYGGEEGLGVGISGDISRYGYTVQWTRYARLERPLTGGPVGLGRLGDDVQRLPPGTRYRWP